MPEVLVEARDLVVRFRQSAGLKKSIIRPVNAVSFTIDRGEILGIVGESGSGKTTLGRTLVGMVQAARGSLQLEGRDVTRLRGKGLSQHWSQVQMIFQDVYNSLNPVYTIEQQLLFPIQRHRSPEALDADQELDRLLRMTGLTPVGTVRQKRPHELSGGQRQRVAAVRALACRPELLIADEPVSMLDVSLRAEVLQLLLKLREELGLTLVYITHDLPTAVYICDRILVMYGGRIVEISGARDVVNKAEHPYTQRLAASATFESAPATSASYGGDHMKSVLLESHRGCPYVLQCPLSMDICRKEAPAFTHVGPNHDVACHAVANARQEEQAL